MGSLAEGVGGYADPHFEQLVREFARLIATRTGGGGLVLYQDGERVVDVWAGTSDRAGEIPWDGDTSAIAFSATKGIAATVIHRLADRGLIDYDLPVAHYWPEFGANGKADMSVRAVLAHQAGLWSFAALECAEDGLLDHRRMEEIIAAARPGEFRGAPAYHALTWGFIISGLARAVTGKGMAQLFQDEITEPLGIENLHLGRPPRGSKGRIAQPCGSLGWARHPVVSALSRVPGPTRNLRHTLPLAAMRSALFWPDVAFLDSELASGNGVMSARALGAAYNAIALGGEIDGVRYLSAERIRVMSEIQTSTPDRVTMSPTRWRLGYQSVLGMENDWFGHIGFGGSAGFANPKRGLSIGFVHNRLVHPRHALHEVAVIKMAKLAERGAAARTAAASRKAA